MTMSNDIINAHLAARTAMLLGEWAGLAPGRKVNNGGNGMAAALMLLSGAVRSEKPSSSTVEKMAENILAKLRTSKDGAYLSFGVDYGPDFRLTALVDECGIRASWPNKSQMSVSKVYSDGSGANSVSVSTGYHAPTISHYLTETGWLVGGVNIPRQLHTLVIKGIAAGDVPSSVATFEPFTA